MHRGLLTQLINARIQQTAGNLNVPFTSATVGFQTIIGELQAFQVQFTPKPGQIDSCITNIYYILQQAKQYGFLPTEIDRAKKNYLSNLRIQDQEHTHKTSQSYTNEIMNRFLRQTPVPDHLKRIYKYSFNPLENVNLFIETVSTPR